MRLREVRKGRGLERLACAALIGAGLLGSLGPTSEATASEACSYEQTTYLGNHPREKKTGWHGAAQGLTHGISEDANWYLSQNKPDRLWRVPFAQDLSEQISCDDPGVACVRLDEIPLLRDRGYDHFGDPDYFDPDPTSPGGYVFMPIEGDKAGMPGAVAVFRSPSLDFVAMAVTQPSGSTHGPWASFDSAGFLYTSEGKSPTRNETLDPFGVFKWQVDWALLDGVVDGGELPLLEPAGRVTLLAPSPGEAACGSISFGGCSDIQPIGDGDVALGDLIELGLPIPQGADFSDDDRLLYLSNGYGDKECGYLVLLDADDPSSLVGLDSCGLHAFEVRLSGSDEACSAAIGDCTAVRIDRSRNGKGPFNFQYNPGFVFNHEEPEGVDWFDLDAPDAPAIPGKTSASCVDPETGVVLDPCPVSGQLHVVLLDIDSPDPDGNDVYVKHYRVERTCEDAARPALRVVPSSHAFADVPVGGEASVEVTVRNDGDAGLEISSLTFAAGAGPGYEALAPSLPADLAAGASVQFDVRFAPEQEGPSSAELRVSSEIPEALSASIALSGTGIGFPAQARALVDAFVQALSDGTLVGAGPGQSADAPALALRHMLESAAALVEAEVLVEACIQLQDALDRTDGRARPPDFVEGPAASELSEEITGLRERLACS